MPPGKEEYIQSLRRLPLFRSLSDSQLEQVVARMEYGLLPAGRTLYKQGDPAKYFYVVMSGRLKASQIHAGEQVRLPDIQESDFFGEESLKRRARRPITVSAEQPVDLLRIPGSVLRKFSRQFPVLKANLEIALNTISLVQHSHLNWLYPDEAVYLMARRHTYFLWEALTGPILGALLSLFLMGLFYVKVLPGTITPILITGAIYIASLFWGIWNYLDWSNDYCLVTSHRVVWLEKVIGFYDSRQEAPITTLLSVGTRTSQTARWIGYGDVLVRTYTGTLTLHQVAHPKQVAALIEDYWTRVKTVDHEEELAVIEDTIRTRLGQGNSSATPASTRPGGTADVNPEAPTDVQPGFFQSLFANLFHLRYVEGGTVTYRKHWFILIKTTWAPLLLMVATGLVAYLGAANRLTQLPTSQIYTFCALAGMVLFLWFLYRYIDWHNDIYQITPEQIVDAEKKPLGSEDRKVAPIENILSVEYRRIGIFALLLNYGTIVITIGSSKFTFETVYNPSLVQQDLFNRMNERVEKRRHSEIAAERERISDWIMVYHRSTHPTEPPDAAAGEGAPQSGTF